MTTMTHDTHEQMDWSDSYALGHPRMDDHHEDFVDAARWLRHCTAGDAVQALERMVRHLEEHFAQEDDWMSASAFPPRDCHIKEHAAVLSSVREVLQALTQQQADVTLVHHLADSLWGWFPAHVDHLDSALAAWLTSRQHGGKPVVLRRDVTRHGAPALP